MEGINMARNDMAGFFWDDTPPPKIIKEKIKRTPPEPLWLADDYLPGLQEAYAFNVDLFTQETLLEAWKNKEKLVFDIECYENYFLVAFASVESGKVCYWEMEYDSKLDINAVNAIINNFTIISFNGNSYDIPILSIAVSGKNTVVLKQATNEIIVYEKRPHDILKAYKSKKVTVDHIDLIEVAPLSASLKIYAGRLHCKKMQDLPFHPEVMLSPPQIAITRYYCINDLVNTALLMKSLLVELDLREELSAEYGVDLRSKSDAQIAEAVIGGELQKQGSGRIIKPVIAPGTVYHYKTPSFIKFQTPLLNWVLQLIQHSKFITSDGGKIGLPEQIAKTPIKIGKSVYTMGIGGLHSTEKNAGFKSNDKFKLIDVDVESFYPRIILNLGLFPTQLGRGFLKVYNGIVVRRIDAKKNKRKKESDSLKIVINGSFGKFGSKFSILYSPDLIIQTTITGQLSLLMLIERFELAGISAISANTDGVVSYVPVEKIELFNAIVKQWEYDTNFKMEDTHYSALYSRDVNNYIAIKTDGSVKHKGAYSNHWNDNSTFRLHKNPTNLICIDAVTDYLTKQIPIEHTIRQSRDITKFITVRHVGNGGGVKVWGDRILPEHATKEELLKKSGYRETHHNLWVRIGLEDMSAISIDSAYNEAIRQYPSDKIEYLGKAIRWYYSEGEEGMIVYANNGNKVPRSEGAKPCMELPNQFPSDIDYEWYIKESYEILNEIGAS